MRSICAAAMQQASAKRRALACGPAIARARAAMSSASAGSCSAGRLRPWRRALRAEIAFPAGVLGPVLASALARLASRRAALLTPPPPAQRSAPRSS
jgi:hypothetical protein